MTSPKRAAAADLGVDVGATLAGKYRVDRILGVGGMGFVIAATHVKLDQRVAIKMLLPESRTKEHVVARFAREARSAAKLKSDHVVRVTDVDELPSGAPFMVMELLEGRDLADLLHARGPLPVSEAVDYVLQACEGVAEAHALGMVHRDLKPANLFLARRADGSAIVKLLDFGISKTADASATGDDLSLTTTEMVIGSPRYMSPEQIKASKDVGPATDIWSLGVILYQLLAASFPFDATSPHALAAQIASEPPTAIEKARADVPEGLCSAIARCLEKDPKKRFANVIDFARAIAPFASELGAASVERAERISRAPANAFGLASTDADPRSDPAVGDGVVDTGVRPSSRRRVTEDLAPPSSRADLVAAPAKPGVEAPAPRSRARYGFVIAAVSVVGIGIAAWLAFGMTTTKTTTTTATAPPRVSTVSTTPSAPTETTAAEAPPSATPDASTRRSVVKPPATKQKDPFELKPL